MLETCADETDLIHLQEVMCETTGLAETVLYCTADVDRIGAMQSCLGEVPGHKATGAVLVCGLS